MNTTSNEAIMIIAIALLTLTVTPAQARGGDMKSGFGGDMSRIEHMASKLGLSEQQQSDFQRIIDEGREKSKSYVQQLVAARKEMQDLMDADVFDEQAVRALAERKSAAMTELVVIHTRTRFEIRSLLTPEQRENLESMRGKHGSHE
jgi:periplasmic protein CpxP/Spy